MEKFPLDLDLLNVVPELRRKLDHSIESIFECFRRWQQGEVGLSFNGGKDSVVLAALVLHVAKIIKDSKMSTENGKIGDDGEVRMVFFLMQKEYPEILSFMRQFAVDFSMNVIELTCGFKQGLAELIGEGENPRDERPMKAIFMGTRREDPDGRNQPCFSPTDPSWPQLVRVNPILDWQYHDIWTFIRTFDLPYCSLYDRGFTSIGSIDDTTTNELLWMPHRRAYAKPWQLPSGDAERLGRRCRRFFLGKPFNWNFLSYPPEVLSNITDYLPFSDVTRLWLCGSKDLNHRFTNGGIRSIAVRARGSSVGINLVNHFSSSLSRFTMIAITSQYKAHVIDRCPTIESVVASLPGNIEDLTLFLPPTKLKSVLLLSSGQSSAMTPTPDLSHVTFPRLRRLALQSTFGPPGFLDSILPSTLEELSFAFHSEGVTFSKLESLKTLRLHSQKPDISLIQSLPQSLTILSLQGTFPLADSCILLLPQTLTELQLPVISSERPGYPPDLPSFPSGLRTLVFGAQLFPSSISFPTRLEVLRMNVMDVSAQLQAGTTWIIPALPESLKSLLFDCFSLTQIATASTNWPPRLESLSASMQFENAEAVARLPRSLTHLECQLSRLSIDCITPTETVGEKTSDLDGEVMEKALKISRRSHMHQALQALPEGLLHLRSSVQMNEVGKDWLGYLPRGLRSLEFQSDRRFHGPHFDRLPPGLTSLTIHLYKHAGAALAYHFPKQLQTLILTADNSFADEMIRLLPRSLTNLSLPANPNTIGVGLKELPPGIRKLHMPVAKVELPVKLMEEMLPPGLAKVQLSYAIYFDDSL